MSWIHCNRSEQEIEFPLAVILDEHSGMRIQFVQTKNANSFAFFQGPLAPKIHSVVVWAQAQIECRSNGEAIACPAATLDGYAAQTAAAIGRATLLVEEQQNWGSQ